ncbi:MAG: STAS domain-containing protein [Isosphaeraceae bacterium]|nr:STAS domain-containing protein [Isosphaeraceae bacterium]
MTISSRTPDGQPNHCSVCGFDLEIDPSLPSNDAPCPRCGHLLWFTWEDIGDAQVIKLSGNLLDAALVGPLFASLERRPGGCFVFDFADAQYVASQILGKLIDLKRKVQLTHGKLQLQNLHPDLREIFRMTRLDQVFDIEH